MKAAILAINGEEPPEADDSGFYWYGATNIDDPEIQVVHHHVCPSGVLDDASAAEGT